MGAERDVADERTNGVTPADEHLAYRAELRRGRFRPVQEDQHVTVLNASLPNANPDSVDVSLRGSGRRLIVEARTGEDGVLAELRHPW